MQLHSVAMPTEGASTCAVRTLAHYKREKTDVHTRGNLIAASATFTCYAIRNGLIRACNYIEQ